MDMTEIRTQVLGGSAIAERVARFRKERVNLIASEEGPARLGDGAKLILHAVPFSSLNVGADQPLPERDALYQFLRPLGGHVYSHRINFDGLLAYSEPGTGSISYLQVFRQGIIETVNADLLNPPNGQKALYGEYIDEKVEATLADIVNLLSALGVSPPVAWILTLIGVKGYEIVVPSTVPFFQPLAIDRDELAVPEVIDLDMTMDFSDIAQRLMDPVWQAGGRPRSLTFQRRERSQE